MEVNPIFFVAIPLLGAFLIPAIGHFVKNFNKIFTLFITLLLFLYALMYVIAGADGPVLSKLGGWEPVNDVPVAIYLVLDGFSGLILLVTGLISFLSTSYSAGYISRFTSENNYYALFCLMIAGMNGVVLSGDIFNMYVFLEIAVIASYALVAFGTEKRELEASFKYQVLGGIASLLILFSVGLLYWQTATLNLADISMLTGSEGTNPALIFTQVLLLSGFGLKAALIPFHAWLPDAHASAPASISAMLSGVLIKAIGAYALFRLFFNVFHPNHEMGTVLTLLGVLSMVIGGTLAIGQRDMKRMLAYSSVSQMGYVIVGVGMGLLVITGEGDRAVAVLAITGGLFHMVNHSVMKGLLFLNAGAVEYMTGTRDFRKLGGLAGDMPLTSTTSLGAALAISGVPPFNGFFSKLLIILAAIRGEFYMVAALAVLMSFVTLGYFLRYHKEIFHAAKPQGLKLLFSRIPFGMRFSMTTMIVLCLLMSMLIIPSVREVILMPAVNAIMDTGAYTAEIFGY